MVHPVFEYILTKTEHDSKVRTIAIFNGYESNQNPEGDCVERLSEQAALKAARKQAEPILEAFVHKKILTFVMSRKKPFPLTTREYRIILLLYQ